VKVVDEMKVKLGYRCLAWQVSMHSRPNWNKLWT